MVKIKYKLENDLKLLNWNDVTNQKLEWLDKSNYLWHLEKEGLITTVDLENATKEYLNKLNLKIRNWWFLQMELFYIEELIRSQEKDILHMFEKLL